MVARRQLFRRDTPKTILRPTLKIPSPTLSATYENSYEYNGFDEGSYWDSFDYSTFSNGSIKSLVALSTPSPSATADGEKVDKELEKFRRLSEEWIRSRETEEAENQVDILGSRSPSPQRVIYSKYPSRRSVSPSLSSRSTSPEKSPVRRSASEDRDASTRSLRSRSPSPLTFSHITKTFQRVDNSETVDKYSSYQRKTEEVGITRSEVRRSPSYEKEDYSPWSYRSALQKQSPLSNIFRRSSSYESDEQLRSNFRSRSTSPNRLNPASSYYHRSNSLDERDNYTTRSRSRSPSPIQNRGSILSFFRRSNSSQERDPEPSTAYNIRLKNIFTDTFGDKYNTLPRYRYHPREGAARKDLFNIFDKNSYNLDRSNRATSVDRREYVDYQNNYKPRQDSYSRQNDRTSPNRMPISQRRYSEEPSSPQRKPLATLHEDEDLTRRRYSDGTRRSPFNYDVLDDYYYRRLSEAGVRKVSDASVVLTEDTDGFIIGDRVWVGGIKPGAISYIGETQFAPGEWAGVTLDEPIGKNDGTVAGIRYFQCEPKKGVFSRLTRLSRIPLSDDDLELLAVRSNARRSESPKSMSTPTPSVTSGPTQRKTAVPSYQAPTLNSLRKSTPPTVEPVRKISPTSYSKNSAPPLSVSQKISGPSLVYSTDLQVGDRVAIDSSSGIKYGVLRHLGRADFADGFWAGVELDEPTGKNDGSVAGKKYFTCRSKYGLFAPVTRVRRTSLTHRSAPGRSSIPSLRRSRSRESLGTSSVGSASVSSVRGTTRPCRTSGYDISPNTRALQNRAVEVDEDGFY